MDCKQNLDLDRWLADVKLNKVSSTKNEWDGKSFVLNKSLGIATLTNAKNSQIQAKIFNPRQMNKEEIKVLEAFWNFDTKDDLIQAFKMVDAWLSTAKDGQSAEMIFCIDSSLWEGHALLGSFNPCLVIAMLNIRARLIGSLAISCGGALITHRHESSSLQECWKMMGTILPKLQEENSKWILELLAAPSVFDFLKTKTAKSGLSFADSLYKIQGDCDFQVMLVGGSN